MPEPPVPLAASSIQAQKDQSSPIVTPADDPRLGLDGGAVKQEVNEQRLLCAQLAANKYISQLVLSAIINLPTSAPAPPAPAPAAVSVAVPAGNRINRSRSICCSVQSARSDARSTPTSQHLEKDRPRASRLSHVSSRDARAASAGREASRALSKRSNPGQSMPRRSHTTPFHSAPSDCSLPVVSPTQSTGRTKLCLPDGAADGTDYLVGGHDSDGSFMDTEPSPLHRSMMVPIGSDRALSEEGIQSIHSTSPMPPEDMLYSTEQEEAQAYAEAQAYHEEWGVDPRQCSWVPTAYLPAGHFGAGAVLQAAPQQTVHSFGTIGLVGELEAIVDGQPTGMGAFTADFSSLFAGVMVEPAIAEAMYAAAGMMPISPHDMVQQQYQVHPGSDYSTHIPEDDWEDVDWEAQAPEPQSPFKPHVPKFSGCKKKKGKNEADVMVFSVRGSSPADPPQHLLRTGAVSRTRELVPRRPATVAGLHEDSAQRSVCSVGSGGSGHPEDPDPLAASDAQMRSVRLLSLLHKEDIRGASAEARAVRPARRAAAGARGLPVAGQRSTTGTPRPNSVAGVVEVPRRPGAQGRASPTLPPCGAPSSARQKPRPKADWDNGQLSARQIPRYDALIDDYCPLMSSPARLKHLMDMRELPDEYLHIVRARFEQHRSLFDRSGQLGVRTRPEPPPGSRKAGERGLVPPRLIREATDLVAPADALSSLEQHAIEGRVGPSLVCCPDWKDSAMHRAYVENWDAGDEEPPFFGSSLASTPAARERPELSVAAESAVAAGKATAGAPGIACSSPNGLQARWERTCEHVEALWYRLQVSAEVCESVHRGPMSSVSPHGLHQLHTHLKELQGYKAATEKVLSAWLQREALIEKIKGTHVLGLNDPRLAGLKADLAKLDRMGVALIRSIGDWSQRFAHFVVDTTRLPAAAAYAAAGQAVRPTFVWGSRDAVERIHSDSDFMAKGELHHVGHAAVVRTAVGQALHLPDGAAPAVAAAAPLVAAAAAAQRSSIADPLHHGPPPPWYSPKVARAGIEALRRTNA